MSLVNMPGKNCFAIPGPDPSSTTRPRKAPASAASTSAYQYAYNARRAALVDQASRCWRNRCSVLVWCKDKCGPCDSDEFDFLASVQTHPQQDQAFPNVLDVRAAVIALIVANRDFDDVQVELRGAEEQVEVTERVEIAKESPSRC